MECACKSHLLTIYAYYLLCWPILLFAVLHTQSLPIPASKASLHHCPICTESFQFQRDWAQTRMLPSAIRCLRYACSLSRWAWNLVFFRGGVRQQQYQELWYRPDFWQKRVLLLGETTSRWNHISRQQGSQEWRDRGRSESIWDCFRAFVRQGYCNRFYQDWGSWRRG